MKHFNMKTEIRKFAALTMIMLFVCRVWAFDFSAVSSSGHRLYYTIVSDVAPRTVKVVAPTGDDSWGYPSWSGYTKPTGNVVVPQTVTYGQNSYTVIGLNNRCFNECNGIITINLPSTIDRIDEYAFYGCYGLTSIAMPNSVKSIGANAFYYCRALQSITLPDSLSCIENDLFHYCDSLRSITIPPYVDSIKSSAFYSSGLTSITIPSSVTFIGSYAFAYTNRLTSISLPSSIRCIQQYAFEGSAYYNNSANWVDSTLYINNHLIKMNRMVSGTLALPAGTIGIADNAIANADNIEALSLPSSLKYIGNNAFTDAYILYSVNLPSGLERIGNRAFSGCLALENVSFGSSLKHIGEYAFENCNLIRTIELPYSLQTIGAGVFYTCDNLDTVIWNAPNVRKISSYNTNTYSDLFNQCNNFKTLIIGDSIRNLLNQNTNDSVVDLSSNQFSNITSLRSVVIGNNVNIIGDNAFNGCNRLASVYIPNSVTYIGRYSFQNCDSLRYVEIPINVEEVAERAFNSCDSLHTVVWNAKKAIMNASNGYGNNVFQNCDAVKLFIIGDSVRYMSDYALRYMHSLDTIIIRGELDSIGKYAFNSINGLDYLSLEKGLSSLIKIGEGAFNNCKGFKVDSLILGNRLVHIGNRAFYNCDSIRYVYIPHMVDTLKWEVFYDCNNIHTVVWNTNSKNTDLHLHRDSWNDDSMFPYVRTFVFGDSVRSVPYRALYGSYNLHTVILGNNVDTIGDEAFRNCYNLRNIDFANATNLRAIGYQAFCECYNLRNIDFVNATNLTTIGNNAFYSCDSLRNINFGNATNLTTIGDNAFNGCINLRDAAGLENATNLVSIGSSAFQGCTALDIDSLIFSNTLKFIGGGAFNNIDSLRYVEIPYSVDTIGSHVFSNCDNLHTVVWNSPRASIANQFSNSWGNQTNLKTLVFGDSVRYIPDNAFNNSKIETLVLSNNLDSIGYQAFYGCDSLRNVNWGNSLNTLIKIDRQAFYECSLLDIDSLSFGNNLKFIGEYAFGYTDVKYLEIPYSLDTIGSTAFSGCDSLTTVIWNSSEARPYNAFNGCDNIETFVFGDSITTLPQNTMVGSSYSYNRTNIRKMVFGSGLTSIASDAFNYIYNVDTIMCKASVPPTLGNANSLPGYSTTIDVLMVPCESTPAYLANTSWSSHFTDIVGDVHISGNADKLAVNNPAYGNVNYDCSTGQMTAEANYGYHFVQWNDGNTQNPRSVSLAGDVLYTAIFAKNIYTISFSDTTKGVFTGGGQFEYLDTITISVAPKYGYNFASWSDGNTNTTRNVVVTENKIYVANFNPIIYNISVVSNNTSMGTVSGGGALPYNSTCTITATPTANEYCLLQWSDGNTDNPRTVTVLGDATYQAVFGPKPTYSLALQTNNSEWGTVSGSGSYLHGTVVQITATANTGYHFTSWSDGSTQSSRSIQMVKDSTIIATFAPNNYTVNVAVNGVCAGMGTVTGGGVYPYGTNIQLSATSNYGYRFSQWSDGNTDNPRTYRVDRTITLYASFVPASFNITLASADESMGTVAGGGAYDYRSEAVLKANSKPGYFFSHWNDGNKENPRVVTVSGDMSYTAYFTDTYVGVEEAEVLENLEFYPNPTEGTITFNNQEIKKIEVLDVMGRIVAVHENSYIIDLSNLSNGIYTMRIELPKGVAIRKVILK